MAYACKTSSAKKIVGVVPYMPYSRQCKRYKQSLNFEFPRTFSLLLIPSYPKMKSAGQILRNKLSENHATFDLQI